MNRPKIKIEYEGRSFWGRANTPMPNHKGWQIAGNRPHFIRLHVTFTATGASGIMYVHPDALPYKYGME